MSEWFSSKRYFFVANFNKIQQFFHIFFTRFFLWIKIKNPAFFRVVGVGSIAFTTPALMLSPAFRFPSIMVADERLPKAEVYYGAPSVPASFRCWHRKWRMTTTSSQPYVLMPRRRGNQGRRVARTSLRNQRCANQASMIFQAFNHSKTTWGYDHHLPYL